VLGKVLELDQVYRIRWGSYAGRGGACLDWGAEN